MWSEFQSERRDFRIVVTLVLSLTHPECSSPSGHRTAARARPANQRGADRVYLGESRSGRPHTQFQRQACPTRAVPSKFSSRPDLQFRPQRVVVPVLPTLISSIPFGSSRFEHLRSRLAHAQSLPALASFVRFVHCFHNCKSISLRSDASLI